MLLRWEEMMMMTRNEKTKLGEEKLVYILFRDFDSVL
jgi:hypothetical protein